ncbi:MAG: ATP-dependent helicase, partial [Desulfobacterales bacterium]|nr:ATP-dependent helicase [Desulfobacterales bacterium]
RLMELSGEVLSGCFFHQIPGPQFISRPCFRMLQKRPPRDAIYWMHAADPASLCGLPLPALKKRLPRRGPGVHLVFHGPDLVVVSQRRGKTMEIHAEPDNSNLPRYFGFLHHLLTRAFQPIRRIIIETINDAPAATSPFLAPLRIAFDADVDHRTIVIFRKRQGKASDLK